MDSKKVPNFILILGASFVLTTIVPLIFIILVPILVARVIVKCVAKCQGDFGDIIGSMSAIMTCADDIYYGRPRCNIVVILQLAGTISLEKLRGITLKNALAVTNSDGSLKFKELQQYPVQFLGFPFYKWDRNFDIENHVRSYTKRIDNEKDFLKYISRLGYRSWPNERSLWEFIRMDNYHTDSLDSTESTVLIFRCHHSLADGYSLANLIITHLGQHTTLINPKPNYNQITLRQKCIQYITLPFFAAYEIMKDSLEKRDVNAFRPKGKVNLNEEHNTVISEKLPQSLIKEVMKENSVSFHSVICAAVAGGIRQYMKSRKIEIPQSMHALYPLPYQGHPNSLANHFALSIAKLPLKIDNQIERLKECDELHKYFRNSVLPIVNMIVLRIFGCGLAPITRILGYNFSRTTLLLSTFPIAMTACTFQGIPITDINVTVGVMTPGCNLGICCCSYNGNIRIVVSADETILPTAEDTENLVQLITEELKALRKFKNE